MRITVHICLFLVKYHLIFALILQELSHEFHAFVDFHVIRYYHELETYELNTPDSCFIVTSHDRFS